MASTGARVLSKLVQAYGLEGVAVRLGIGTSLLERLLAGTVAVPDRLFVLAVDLLLDVHSSLPVGPPPSARKTPPAAS
jgi:hypothetical protein